MKIKVTYKNATVEIDATAGELIKVFKETFPLYIQHKLKG